MVSLARMIVRLLGCGGLGWSMGLSGLVGAFEMVSMHWMNGSPHAPEMADNSMPCFWRDLMRFCACSLWMSRSPDSGQGW